MSGREIHVNGVARPLREETVEALLRDLGFGGERSGIAVAVNERVLRRSAWTEHRLAPGDRVEIVGAMQGG